MAAEESEVTTQDRMMASRALASRIKRYHCIPVIHQETVGEHSHRVCTLYLQLFSLPRVEVLEYILYHDMGELSAGDLPFNAKRDVPEMKHFMDRAEEAGLKRLDIEIPHLTEIELARIKLCDLLQMLEFACIELNMGNQYARSVQENILAALEQFDRLPAHQVQSGALAVLLGTRLRDEE
jgi:5'-deoxynucleotidase YfbR-like HD superfamily hydrolase